MKKYIALTVAALMAVLCLASCNKNNEPTDAANPSAEQTTVAEATTEAATTTEAEATTNA